MDVCEPPDIITAPAPGASRNPAPRDRNVVVP
jgi:hypothetical protein